MRRKKSPAGRVHASFRRDADELTAGNLGLAAWIFFGLVGLAGVFEHAYYPSRLRWFIPIFAIEMLGVTSLFLLRSRLLRAGRIVPACVALGAFLAISLNLYILVSRGAPEMGAIGLVCLMTGLPLLFPWGTVGQLVIVATTILGFAGVMIIHPTTAVPPLYTLFGLSAGGCLSLVGAHYLDLHRWAIFRETMLKDEEAQVAQALLKIADDLNASLDARAVIGRIARNTCQALDTSWSVILLWDQRRSVFRIAGTDGNQLEQPEIVESMEYPPAAFPIIERALREDMVTVRRVGEADRVTAGFMQRYGIHALVLTTLVRGGQVIGLLAAGRQQPGAFSQRTHRLLRGIAHQAAIALENVRLVTDLRHADRMKSEFVATMSHELRTPLNVILGYNELLLDGTFGPLRAEQRGTLERIQASSSDLLELINATLNVNRLQAGQSAVQLEEVRLDTLLSEITAEAERLPRHSLVQLKWNTNGHFPSLRSDPGKLKIIIKNLVNNALKFTEHGMVTISVHHEGERLEIAVADTGIGIPESDLPHIFEMFHQSELARARESGGVGLGLYIVHRFVDMLGGEIDVQSAVGTGTTFRVRLPLRFYEQRAA
jgi:signal transduction histidine kinase